MAEAPTYQDVVCAHCGKPFRAEILSPETEQAGFKCPHCRLFMPAERVEWGEAASAEAS